MEENKIVEEPKKSSEEPNSLSQEKIFHEEITDPKELDALEKLILALQSLTKPEEKELITPSILEDKDLLIRFLRAEKFNIKKVVPDVIGCAKWRKNTDFDKIYNFALTKEQVSVIQFLYPNGFHKTTKSGHPVFIQIFGRIKPDEIFDIIPFEDLITYSIRNYVQMNRVHFKICSQIHNKLIWGNYNIIDCKGMTKSVFNKKLYDYISQNSDMINKYFPDCLRGVYLLNTGLLFRALYTIIKVFLDEKTKKSFKIYGSNYQKDLLELIDANNLPKFLGGNCECEGGCVFSNAGPWQDKCPRDELKDVSAKTREDVHNFLMGIKKK